MRSKSCFGSILDGADVGDAGVVHEDVDCIDARETGFHRVGECDVAFEGGCGAAGGANLLDGGAGRFKVAIEREHTRAVLRERRCDRQADARARASDNRRFSIESKHARTVKQAAAR